MLKRGMYISNGNTNSDPALVLDAVRTYAETGCGMSSALFGGMMMCVNNHGREAFGEGGTVSGEIIRQTLNGILLGRYANEGLILLDHLDLIEIILPELHEMVSMTTIGHKDVWNHTLGVLRNGFDLPTDVRREISRIASEFGMKTEQLVERITVRLRWSLLLHDIGKARTRSYGNQRCPVCGVRSDILDLPAQCGNCFALLPIRNDQRLFFRNHEVVGEEMARDLMTRLGYDEQMVRWVSRDVGLHDFDKGIQHNVLVQTPKSRMRSHHTEARQTAIENAADRLRDVENDADQIWGDLNEMLRWHLIIADATGRPQAQMDIITSVRSMVTAARASRKADQANALLNTPLISGDELQQMASLPPGPWIGAAHELMRRDRRSDPNGHNRERATEIGMAVVNAVPSIPSDVKWKDRKAWLVDNVSI
jgi:hypothetical protein